MKALTEALGPPDLIAAATFVLFVFTVLSVVS